MKTTIYDLLGMIKDGKAPKKIIYNGRTFDYLSAIKDYYSGGADEYLFEKYVITNILNDEVEILETTIIYKQDDKIEKLSILTFSDLIDMSKEELVDVIKEQRFKINEIIDKVNKLL